MRQEAVVGDLEGEGGGGAGGGGVFKTGQEGQKLCWNRHKRQYILKFDRKRTDR